MTTKKLIEEVLSLPVEERALIADSLLRSLNAPDAAIDAKWIEVAKRRQEEHCVELNLLSSSLCSLCFFVAITSSCFRS
jgi:hypothetical protein